MATLANTRPENQEGSLYVDRSCINCGTCRIIAPGLFAEVTGKSAVVQQPSESSEWVNASRAIISCPTNSIGSKEKHSPELKEAISSFPSLIEDGVYYCGYVARESYGASSYLIVRKGGNVLVDSPRFNPQLVKQIEKLGGVKYLFLTHKDDVADHALFQKHFGCERIIHADDVTSDTEGAEKKTHGEAPFPIAEELLVIPTPGHTKGHMVLLYKNRFLFSGDHIAGTDDGLSLLVFEDACWYSWPKQIESVKKLLDYEFEWILPGHGAFCRLNKTDMRNALHQLNLSIRSNGMDGSMRA